MIHSDRNLALALIQVVQMWSNPRYEAFLNKTAAATFTEEWFKWFVGSWKVARNIKDGYQEQVRKYLDCEFRQALAAENWANCVDAAALYIQRQGWTPLKHGALSLASKAGFILLSDKLVPKDRYSTQGLNCLRVARRAGKLKGKSYKEYLEAFDQEYAISEAELTTALNHPWVLETADRFGCPRNALAFLALRRKLFDDYLMYTGGYKA